MVGGSVADGGVGCIDWVLLKGRSFLGAVFCCVRLFASQSYIPVEFRTN